MSGRRRRASTSSVESVDESQIRWRQEKSVVRSVPSDMHSDNWPIFELRDAVVLNRDGQTLENALHVGIRGPFIVRGHLVIDDPRQRSNLVMRFRSSMPLEIPQCIAYSVGEAVQDNSPVIWVSGRGGWYEISPSPAYRPIYRKMCEATTLYYNLVDIYKSRPLPKKSKKARQPSFMDELGPVFLKYAARVGDGCTFDDVIARCSEHAAFFISQFAQQEEDIDWKSTAFYKWLTSEHSDLFAKQNDLTNKSLKPSPIPTAEAPSPRPRESWSTPVSKSASVDVIDSRELVARPKRRSRGTSSLASAAATTATSASASASASVAAGATAYAAAAAAKLAARDAEPQVASPRVASPQVASQPPEEASSHPTPPADAAAGDNDSAFATVFRAMEDVYDALSGSKKGLTTSSVLGKLYFTYSVPNHRDGSAGSYKTPVQEVLHYHAAALLASLDKSKYEAHEVYSFLQELSKADFRPVAYKPSDFPLKFVPRRRQPRQSKKSVPPAPAPVDGSAAARADPDDAQSDDAPPPRGKGLKGPGRSKKSSLRPASAPRKRPRAEFETDDESEASGPKTSHHFDDGDDAMDDAPLVAPQTTAPATPSADEPIHIVIRAERAPSVTPHGPDETWTCDQEGCDYIVRGGDELECQARIRQHFHDHEQQLERVSLAVSESRGHLPINHLLDKIKRMGDKTAAPRLAPTPPIKRRLIV